MLNKRVARVFLVGCVMVSILVSLAPPGVSKEGRSHRCPRFKPVEPESLSELRSEAADAKVLTVRDDATKKNPMAIELDFGLALWIFDPRGNPNDPDSIIPILEDTQFLNLQVDSSQRQVALNTELVWDSPPGQIIDFDEYLYDSRGRQIGAGLDGFGTCCPPAEPMELVTVLARDCDGFTLEARAFRTPPDTSVTLKVWLEGPGIR